MGFVFIAMMTVGARGQDKPVERTPVAKGDQKEQEVELDVRDLIGEAKITLSQALAAGLKAHPGQVVEVDLEGDVVNGKRSVAFEVTVLGADSKFVVVKIDPATGTVLSSAEETEADEVKELMELQKVLPKAALSMEPFLAAADKLLKGTPCKVGLAVRKGQLVAEVNYVNGRNVVKATLDIATHGLTGLHVAKSEVPPKAGEGKKAEGKSEESEKEKK